MDNSRQTIISIATGTGGLERGLELAGCNIRVAAYVEVEAFIIANLVSAMETNKMDAAPVWVDVKTFPSENFRGKIHGITAGYPCQPFSHAGKRKGTTDKRHIFPHILRVIKTVEPIWCFFENVSGHLSMGYAEVYRSLRHLGYNVESGIFSAEEVGAPHSRKRLYILAIKMEYANASTIKRVIFTNETKQSNFRNTSKMANACSKRKRESMQGSKSGVFNTTCYKWPVGRGKSQYAWEASRTIESGLGCTANGYDFRIDLLRALGNGVVPQTAAKAFKSLLGKF
ncbi:DNA cytosine methyltransferase [Carboxylicivirga linearis]|uniref:DNA (cytosine-5-)-methyltransferase n=1 Tax=Carboxylicivirga linearis TaxID=1628157 RepID=A0ABS5K2F1_9BACT|nr:DNA cytosine methyltransferase [Carboxylicivirga linearis]MBS2100691.1 DNA cytosine methyltransferase [Carboxylicivirga linearis]